MGWLRFVGSFKLYVSFAEYRLFCRALLQKRPVILRRLREAATRSKYEKQLQEATMGWLRLVGSFKLYVSFAEYRLFCRALLQKRPVILRSLRKAATRSKYEKQLPEATMGWLRLVGSLKLYVSLENMSLFCRALLQRDL